MTQYYCASAFDAITIGEFSDSQGGEPFHTFRVSCRNVESVHVSEYYLFNSRFNTALFAEVGIRKAG